MQGKETLEELELERLTQVLDKSRYSDQDGLNIYREYWSARRDLSDAFARVDTWPVAIGRGASVVVLLQVAGLAFQIWRQSVK